MKPEDIDIDWLYLIEKVESLVDLGEEFLRRRVDEIDLDPQSLVQNNAFVWTRDGAGGFFREVGNPGREPLSDFIGLEKTIATLRRNTLQFILGYPANNLLLWGEKGSGKSSCLKGLLAEFAPLGLRLIEIKKEDFDQLPLLLKPLRHLPFRFILFCDDLTFNEGDVSYRNLKGVLEGGIEERPDNMIIYATSNRRHFLAEYLPDNGQGNEIHPEEALAEKLSLADRFGLRIPFYSINQETYLKIVAQKLKFFGVRRRRNSYILEALQWATAHGGFSGRVAQQFAADYSGRFLLEQNAKKSS